MVAGTASRRSHGYAVGASRERASARRQPGSSQGGTNDAAPLGQDEYRRLPVSEKIEIITEVPSEKGSYQRTDEHGRVVYGDASGEWTLDENGDFEDIVFLLSPSAMRRWTADPGD
jgi:hypothetical protein